MSWMLEHVISGKELSEKKAFSLLDEPLEHLMEAAKKAKELESANNVSLCSILNAKCGACSEDCSFCIQSSHYNTSVQTYPLLEEQAILSAYDQAAQTTAIERFSIVTSGGRLSNSDVEKICAMLQKRKDPQLKWCASLGCLSHEQLCTLKSAGLCRYHHNLEACESLFPSICSTHSYKTRIETVLNAQKAGLEICCGGIFGIGESPRQRVELALEIRQLNVDSVPLNFLIPMENTPAYTCKRLTKEDILQTIAIFRLICPNMQIRVCGGREYNLGNDDNQIFHAGADGMMVGGYLTKPGAALERDLAMVKNEGLSWL